MHYVLEPLVSILMTAYNRERYISEAIESVLASTYQNWELIIVDDCSKDDTVSIARSYEARDNRIKVYINERNLGDYPNRNKAAGYAKGKYLMSCDSDDSLLPNGVDDCVQAMENFPDAGFGLYWAYNEAPPFVRSPSEAADKNFFGEPFLGMGPGGTILKRDYFFKIGCYPIKYGPANDMYFNLKAICYTNTVLIPKLFISYRIHDNQERNNKKSYLINNYLYQKDAFDELPLPLNTKQIKWLSKKNKRRFFVNLVRYFFDTWNWRQVRELYVKSDFQVKDLKEAIFQL